MSNQPTPTDAELLLLQTLWESPDITVHAVHEIVSRQREVAYTTVLTQLQRMHKKELVTRTKSGKQHLYRAAIERKHVEKDLLDRLSDRIFGGSSVRLALSALGRDEPTSDELDELQRWLDEHKKA